MATSSLLDAHISVFKNATTATNPEEMAIAVLLKKIQKGTWKASIQELRQLYRANKESAYQAKKKRLPAATFQGTFLYRANSGLRTVSGIFLCDADHLGDQLPKICEMLRQTPYVAFFFLSPSGDGVKFGVRVPQWTTEAEYKFLFQQIATYTERQFGFKLDQARSDVAGLCFVSYDPNCYSNAQPTEFPIDWEAFRSEQKRQQQATEEAQRALDAARQKLAEARTHKDQREVKGFEKWKSHALDFDIQWMETRLRAAAPGDPVHGRHQAYLACGLRAGSILAGYAQTLTSEATLLAIIKSIRADFRAKADERAFLEMIPFGRETPKTDAELWQQWEKWKADHPESSNGNGTGKQQPTPLPVTKQPPPAAEEAHTLSRGIYREVRKQAIGLWKAKQFAEGITCFVRQWEAIQPLISKPMLIALLSQYLPPDQDASALVEKTFRTPVDAIPGEGTGGMADNIRDAIATAGFTLTYNELRDIVYVNGKPIDDSHFSVIFYPLLNAGFSNQGTIKTVALAVAQKSRFHPIKDYLQNLQWDGQDRFAQFATYFQDRDGVFPLYLRKFMIGSIAKIRDHQQNPMLILMGAQGLGKGYFCRWLCPLQELFVSCSILPDSKDHQIRVCARWIWEAEEFGATTRRADLDALKAFIFNDKFTVRHPYGHYDIDKYAAASFIGTINDDGTGVLSDVTGNRRYRPVYLTQVNRDYATSINVQQLWAQAYAYYLQKETVDLPQPDEETLRLKILPQYKRENPMEDLIYEYFVKDEISLLSSTEILTILFELGYKGKYTRADAMDLANVMKALGISKGHDSSGNKRGYHCRYLFRAATTAPGVSTPTVAQSRDDDPLLPDHYASLIQ